MTAYMGIFAEQEPFDIGLDDAGRPQFSFNVLAHSRPSPSFVADVVTLLVDAAVGVRGTTLFESSAAPLPSNDSPVAFLHVRTTGGLAPVGTHNDGPTAYRRPSAIVIATARTSAAAEALALAAYNALAAQRNVQVSA